MVMKLASGIVANECLKTTFIIKWVTYKSVLNYDNDGKEN